MRTLDTKHPAQFELPAKEPVRAFLVSWRPGCVSYLEHSLSPKSDREKINKSGNNYLAVWQCLYML